MKNNEEIKDGQTFLIAPDDYKPIYRKEEPTPSNKTTNHRGNSNSRTKCDRRHSDENNMLQNIKHQRNNSNSTNRLTLTRKRRSRGHIQTQNRRSSRRTKQSIRTRPIYCDHTSPATPDDTRNTHRRQSLTKQQQVNQPSPPLPPQQQFQPSNTKIKMDSGPTALIAPDDYVAIYRGDNNNNTSGGNAPNTNAQTPPTFDNAKEPPIKDGQTFLIAPEDYVPIYKGTK
ncbi:hypothetical protein RDWZM_000245 [Blomia tropicalis]|uniref:Uncharacterized protein n=1 Tax=Blomia tropicalis TaxID=40697 RepID=A0A9Q0M9I4_BLOTA|nr:hypothetical protein BLOT_013086 [Blomia tropicalis]KAJ6221700.1 hypothetical protein RDWZM_000245 [Blomia tropicalis]